LLGVTNPSAKQLIAAEVYPEIWDGSSDEDAGVGYLVENFVKLKRFLERGAAKGLALIVYLN
jgi:hypothetical protein